MVEELSSYRPNGAKQGTIIKRSAVCLSKNYSFQFTLRMLIKAPGGLINDDHRFIRTIGSRSIFNENNILIWFDPFLLLQTLPLMPVHHERQGPGFSTNSIEHIYE